GSGLDTCDGADDNGAVANGGYVTTATLGAHSFSVTAKDKAGNTSTQTVTYTVVDVTKPTITIATPAQGATYLLNQVVNASYSCQDEAGGSGLSSCNGTVANGAAISTSSVGQQSFMVTAGDNAGNPNSMTVTYTVAYNFSGFFQPVDNAPTVNTVKAGSGIPVKFSLGGNQGLAIFAAGFPASQQIACDSSAPISPIEETVAAGASSLSYDPTSNQYIYVWKTDAAWKG